MTATPEQRKKYNKRYNELHKEQIKQYNKQYNKDHKEQIKEEKNCGRYANFCGNETNNTKKCFFF